MLAPISRIALLLLASSCATAKPYPVQTGDWRIGGASRAVLQRSEYGSIETDRFSGQASLGRFVTENLSLEVAGLADFQEARDDFGNEDALSEVDVLGGVRYYFTTDSNVRPYVRALAGLAFIRENPAGGAEDDDTAPVFLGQVGFEAFLSDVLSVDVGFAYQQASAVELQGFEDDVKTIGMIVGLSIWF